MVRVKDSTAGAHRRGCRADKLTVQGFVHGVRFVSRTDNPLFHRYVRASYAYFLRDEAIPAGAPEIDSTLLFRSQIAVPNLSGFEKVGYGLYCRGNELYYDKDGLRVLVTVDAQQKRLGVLASFRVTPVERLRKLVGYTYRAPRYLRVFRFLELLRHHLHFPLFWLLEKDRGIYLMHGAAFQCARGNIVWVGMDGAGKSTALFEEMQDPETRFLSDNYVLFDKEFIYAFPDTVRLSDQAFSLVSRGGRGCDFLSPTGLRFEERTIFRITEDRIIDKFKPTEVSFITLAPKKSSREIAPARLEGWIKIIDDYVKEFHNYTFWETLYLLDGDCGGLQERKLAACEALLGKVRTRHESRQLTTNDETTSRRRIRGG